MLDREAIFDFIAADSAHAAVIFDDRLESEVELYSVSQASAASAGFLTPGNL